MRIRISFFPHNLSNNLEKARPMIATFGNGAYDNALSGKGRRVLVVALVG